MLTNSIMIPSIELSRNTPLSLEPCLQNGATIPERDPNFQPLRHAYSAIRTYLLYQTDQQSVKKPTPALQTCQNQSIPHYYAQSKRHQEPLRILHHRIQILTFSNTKPTIPTSRRKSAEGKRLQRLPENPPIRARMQASRYLSTYLAN